jgi:phosphatidylglycerophosphate synthase
MMSTGYGAMTRDFRLKARPFRLKARAFRLKAEATKSGGTKSGVSSGTKSDGVAERRELRTRNAGWARRLAGQLARLGVRPNAVSAASVGFAAGAGLCLAASSAVAPNGARAALLLAAAALVQLRLLCNLLDGMLAVEEGLAARNGVLYNEIPDRIADVIVLAGAGYAVGTSPPGAVLGWTAAVLALFTAYVRVLAGSLGARQNFAGPMAKQHRMFTITAAAVASAAETWLGLPMHAMALGLWVVVSGSIATIVRRVHRMAGELEGR